MRNVVDEDVATVLVYLAEAYGTRLTEARIRIYANALADLTIDQVKSAASRAVRESRFFPSVAELRQMVDLTAEDAALVAWAGLQKQAADVGAYAQPNIDDPVAAASVVAVFGSWAAYCELEDGPQLSQKRQEFLAQYRATRRRGLAAGARLHGLTALGVVDKRQLDGRESRLLEAGTAEGGTAEAEKEPSAPPGDGSDGEGV
jgi:hypothetical protein